MFMKWKKWSLLVVLLFAVGLVLAACGGDDNGNDKQNNGAQNDTTNTGTNDDGGDAEKADEQVLNVNIKEEPPSLHPGKSSDTTSSAVLDQIFEGLTRINQDGEPEEAMAESIDIS